MLTRFFLLLSCVYFSKGPTVSADEDHPWCYKEEKCAPIKWAGLCESGHSQSPVDIVPSLTNEMKQLDSISINEDYTAIHPEFLIKNNGHTIQVQLNEQTTSTMLLTASGLPGAYRFSQIHFHWGSRDNVGSEHTIGGTSYPMEVHLVHYGSQYENILEAVSDPNNQNSLAVFGVFFKFAPTDNPVLTPIIEALVPVTKYHPDPLQAGTGNLNFSALFPEVMEVYRYHGSLTTPSCGEKVIWTVFRRPIPISKRQLEAFRKVQDIHGHPLVDNFRPTQALIGRTVSNGTLNMTPFNLDKIHENDIDDNNPSDSSEDSKNKDHSGAQKADEKKNDAPRSIQMSLALSVFVSFVSLHFVVS